MSFVSCYILTRDGGPTGGPAGVLLAYRQTQPVTASKSLSESNVQGSEPLNRERTTENFTAPSPVEGTPQLWCRIVSFNARKLSN